MSQELYPEFAPEPRFQSWGKSASLWSDEEAKRYYDWLMNAKSVRIEKLLMWLGIASTGLSDVRVSHIGRKASVLLREPKFSVRGHQIDLTSEGTWFSADLGLLWGEDLLRRNPDRLAWRLVTKPKNYINYHLPVISGFAHEMDLNPINNGMNLALQFLQGTATINELCSGFLDWERWLV